MWAQQQDTEEGRESEVWGEHRDPGHIPTSGSGTCERLLCLCGLDTSALNTAKLGVVAAVCGVVLDHLHSGSPGPWRGPGRKLCSIALAQKTQRPFLLLKERGQGLGKSLRSLESEEIGRQMGNWLSSCPSLFPPNRESKPLICRVLRCGNWLWPVSHSQGPCPHHAVSVLLFLLLSQDREMLGLSGTKAHSLSTLPTTTFNGLHLQEARARPEFLTT